VSVIVDKIFRNITFAGLLLGLSVATNIGLALRLRQVAPAQSPVAGPAIGQKLASLEATDRHGNPISVRFSDSQLPTLVYVVRPGCGWCKRNMANMRSVIAQSDGRFRVVLVSTGTDMTGEYGDEPPVLIATPETLQTYRLGATPDTLLVAPDGRVLENWMGAYASQQEEIERRLGVHLPGLVVG
jgi:hypothetical protein